MNPNQTLLLVLLITSLLQTNAFHTANNCEGQDPEHCRLTPTKTSFKTDEELEELRRRYSKISMEEAARE